MPILSVPGLSADSYLEQWRDFSRTEGAERLMTWMRGEALKILTGNRHEESLSLKTPEYFGRLGIFVTLIKGREVRGCYGAFHHREADFESMIRDYLDGALRHDPRYEPLDVAELDDTEIIITVTTPPRPVADVYMIDTYNEGVRLQCGSRILVYVPAEILSTSYLVQKIAERDCQVSSFRAITIDSRNFRGSKGEEKP